VEGLKDELRTVILVGMVEGRYAIFAQIKSAAEAIDFKLWMSRRKTYTAVSSTTWQATKPTTGALLVMALPTITRQGAIRYR
jgi:hypothetical protein